VIEWRPFDLHPEYPPEGIPRELLEQRYGPDHHQRLFGMFDAAGLPHAERLEKVPSSRRALVLGEIARDQGLHGELHPRLFEAFWVEGLDIGSDDVLVDLAEDIGMDRADTEGKLSAWSPALLGAIEEETRGAVEMGVTGVPGWLIDQRLLVPGAQPHEVFERVLTRLGHQPEAV
jgi:predicted DsbA family dithiol-disulfide isomerase